MRKYTPGPWRSWNWNVIGADNSVVCKVIPWDCSGCREEDVSNINIIAAAPDLLEAAKSLINDIRQRHPNEELTCKYIKALETACSRAENS